MVRINAFIKNEDVKQYSIVKGPDNPLLITLNPRFYRLY